MISNSIYNIWKNIKGNTQSNEENEYTLIYEDNFLKLNSNNLAEGYINTNIWTYIPKGNSPWNKNKTDDTSVLFNSDNPLIEYLPGGGIRLYGRQNSNADTGYYTAGIRINKTSVRYNIPYGKIEVTARFHNGENASGIWPAIWIAGVKNNYTQGDGYKVAEIDISEYLNNNEYTYCTLHSNNIYTYHPSGYQVKGPADIDYSSYNVYSVEWTDTRVIIKINDKQVLNYRHNNEFGGTDNLMNLILDAQVGGTWAGEVNAACLPVWMDIKNVKIYGNQ